MADTQVEVWDYNAQAFIPHISCPGEQRVRVDYFGDLSNLAVFEVERNGREFFVIDGNNPLGDWRIDLS